MHRRHTSAVSAKREAQLRAHTRETVVLLLSSSYIEQAETVILLMLVQVRIQFFLACLILASNCYNYFSGLEKPSARCIERRPMTQMQDGNDHTQVCPNWLGQGALSMLEQKSKQDTPQQQNNDAIVANATRGCHHQSKPGNALLFIR